MGARVENLVIGEGRAQLGGQSLGGSRQRDAAAIILQAIDQVE
jgi:hypothetical protein